VLARLNPNVPDVDLPLFLFELREAPKMIRDLGNFLKKPLQPDVPGSYLAYQFGWKPLFSDLHKLANLAETISKMESHYETIARKQSASGSLDSYNTSWKGGTQTGSGISWKYEYQLERKVWFSARAVPVKSAPYFGESPHEALRRTLGLNLSASTIWNALPWSWLVDYFVGVGDYLDASRGTSAFDIKSICIMVHDIMDVSPTDIQATGSTIISGITNGTLSIDRMRRFVHPAPKRHFAFASDPFVGKLGILGALATQSALKR
jgi:hypothetical protein